ncbi:transcriptional regulator [Bombiscardovia apis]|uniref:Transcriptional regulator n=1 Tax=Bombiscardovia apis TaxID=2932182 RepID=A0ABM8BAU4_9BIFI|nr:transcriptional regulator [Bombiscardovia apis]
MTDLTLMTLAKDPATVLPALALLSHRVRVLPLDAASLVKMPEDTILFVDACDDLAGAKTICNLLKASGLNIPVILILREGGFTVVNQDWGLADLVVSTASPAEVEARLRLVCERGYQPELPMPMEHAPEQNANGQIRSGDLIVDPTGYTARLRGQPIDLAYKEFELLKYLVQHPSRVFTRAQLLQEVWGYDYYGGTRTVDVHIRRLRAKLGGEYEHVIGTVRNVGYRFDPEEAANAEYAQVQDTPNQSEHNEHERKAEDSHARHSSSQAQAHTQTKSHSKRQTGQGKIAKPHGEQ